MCSKNLAWGSLGKFRQALVERMGGRLRIAGLEAESSLVDHLEDKNRKGS